jgi:FHS family L-fucose permease-like MFS transporter
MACLLVSFCLRPEIGYLTAYGAAAYVALYGAAIAAGRVAGAGLLAVVPAKRLIGSAAVGGCLLVAAAVGSGGRLALWSLILAGSAMSTLLPAVHALGVPSRALLAALAGGSLVPVFECVLAIRIGVQGALVVPAVCCLYLVFYGFSKLEPYAGGIVRPERRTSVCSIRTPTRSSWLPR